MPPRKWPGPASSDCRCRTAPGKPPSSASSPVFSACHARTAFPRPTRSSARASLSHPTTRQDSVASKAWRYPSGANLVGVRGIKHLHDIDDHFHEVVVRLVNFIDARGTHEVTHDHSRNG